VRLKLSRLLWALLLACAFLALSSGGAEARAGLASWYGPGFKGQPTASGEPFDPRGYTAAHKTLPLGTDLVVNYGGRSVEVTVNDRGPYAGARELDLSRAAARDLGLTRVGVDYVEYTKADRVYGGSYDARYSTYSGTDYSGGAGYSAYSAPRGETGGYSSTDQTGTSGGTYVIQQGDTLSGIALQLGTSVEYLAASNGIADPDVIYAGQTLYY
jgi:rare lipoprotein A